jgi:murein L,D-transpeptidase YcbB/YkuD
MTADLATDIVNRKIKKEKREQRRKYFQQEKEREAFDTKFTDELDNAGYSKDDDYMSSIPVNSLLDRKNRVIGPQEYLKNLPKEVIRKIQQELGIKVDGSIGPNTIKMMERFLPEDRLVELLKEYEDTLIVRANKTGMTPDM